MKDFSQYKMVKENLKHIVGTLKSNTAAHDAMRINVKSEGWLEVYDKPTPEDLVSIILNCIAHKTSDYDQGCKIGNMSPLLVSLTYDDNFLHPCMMCSYRCYMILVE